MKRVVAVASLLLAVLAIVVSAEAGRVQPAAAQGDRFYVVGFVKTPGSFVYAGSITVREGIALAGGLTERASTEGIKIRRTADGQPVEIDAGLDTAVQANDTIVVRRRML